MPATLDGKPQLTCPRRLILDAPGPFYEALHLFNLYDRGVLLTAGGADEQPANYMDLMQVISAAVSEIEAELSRRASAA